MYQNNESKSSEPRPANRRGKGSAERHREKYLEAMGAKFMAARRAALLQRLGSLQPDEIWQNGQVVQVDRPVLPSEQVIPDLFADLPKRWQCERLTTYVAPTTLGLPVDTPLKVADEVSVVAVVLSPTDGVAAIVDKPQASTVVAAETELDISNAPTESVLAGETLAESEEKGAAEHVSDPSLQVVVVADDCFATRRGLTEPLSSFVQNGPVLVKDFSLSGSKGRILPMVADSQCSMGMGTCADKCRACTGLPDQHEARISCGNLQLRLRKRARAGGTPWAVYVVEPHDCGVADCPPSKLRKLEREEPPLPSEGEDLAISPALTRSRRAHSSGKPPRKRQ